MTPLDTVITEARAQGAHVRLLTQHDRQLADVFTDLGRELRAGLEPQGPITRANTWHGNLRATNTDPGRTGDPGDPTGTTATNRQDWTTTIAGEIAAEALALGRRAQILRQKIRMIDRPHETAKAADELADQNTGRGWCEICGEPADGTRDSRLSTLTVKINVTHHGVAVNEQVYTRRVDQACRKAWGRHTADHGSVDFLDWEQQRKHGRERETA